jgi:hypothetical protein
MYTIPEVLPSSYTRVLATISGTKCAEHDYIIVHKTGSELLPSEDEECKEVPLFAPSSPRLQRRN